MTVDIASAAQEAGSIRKATDDELPRVAAALAEAFYDDPQFSWIVPDDRRRLDILERTFLLFLEKIWFKQDETYTTDGVVGACVWERPGEWKLGVMPQLRMTPALISIFGRLLAHARDHHRRVQPPRRAALLPALRRRRERLAGPGHRGRPGCGRSWSAAIVTGCPRISRPPRRATARCTSGRGSRSPRSSTSARTARRSGRCGASPRRPAARERQPARSPSSAAASAASAPP